VPGATAVGVLVGDGVRVRVAVTVDVCVWVGVVVGVARGGWPWLSACASEVCVGVEVAGGCRDASAVTSASKSVPPDAAPSTPLGTIRIETPAGEERL